MMFLNQTLFIKLKGIKSELIIKITAVLIAEDNK